MTRHRRLVASAKAIASDGWCVKTENHVSIECDFCPSCDGPQHDGCVAGRVSRYHSGTPDSPFAMWFVQWLKENDR